MKHLILALLLLFTLSINLLAQSDWHTYPVRSIADIIAQHSGENSKKADLIVSANPFPSKTRVIYTGKSRPVGYFSKNFVNIWVQTRNVPAENAEMIVEEYLFREEDREYWIPVIKTLVPFFGKELKEGEEITIYYFFLGGFNPKKLHEKNTSKDKPAIAGEDKIEWIFAVEEFEKTTASSTTQPLTANKVKAAENAGISEEFLGKLEPELIPDLKNDYGALFKSVNDFSRYKFSEKFLTGASVTSGQFHDPRKTKSKIELVLVEPKEPAAPYICSDLNADAVMAEDECVRLALTKDNPDNFEGFLKLPLETPLFKSFPIFVRYRKNFRTQNMKPSEKLVMQSLYAFAVGYVNIKERKTRVEYNFDPSLKTISATGGWCGIDADGDGKIRNQPFSPESGYANKEEIIFRLGNNYVSTSRIDLEKNQIVMRTRAADEYRRQELEVGTQMPDFSFVDFDDKNRKLSEFRGKYLLIDFWGLWCVDCRRELPHQLAAYKQFRERNFEILGLDTDDDVAQVKEFLAKNKLTWTQAKQESIKDLIEVTYRIQEYPSLLLLSPDGKVLVLDQKKLSGEELSKTLNQLLPR